MKKSAPKGMHKMPDGSMMKNSDMAGRALKKKGADAKGRAMKSGKTGYGGVMAMGMKKGGKAKKGM